MAFGVEEQQAIISTGLTGSRGLGNQDQLKELFGGLSTSLNSTLGAYQEAKDTQQGLDISNAVEDIAVSQTPDDAMVEKQVTGEVASLKDARVQGALNEVEFTTKLNALTKSLIAKDPGNADKIRGWVAASVGTSPANDIRKAKLQAIADARASSDAEWAKIQTYESQKAGILMQPEVKADYERRTGKKFEFGQTSDLAVLQTVVGAWEAEAAKTAYMDAKAGQGKYEATEALNLKMNNFMKGAFNATVTQSFKPFVDAINKAQSASSPGGPLLTAEEKKIVGPMLVALKREITLKAQDVFTEALGDPRYRKYISMADFDTFMKIPNQTLNTLDMMVNSENVDGLKALMNDFSYTREEDKARIMRTSPTVRYWSTLLDLNVHPDVIKNLMTDTGNMDRVSKEINDAFTGFVSSGLGTIDEGYNDLKNDPKVKNPGAVLTNSLKAIGQTLSNGNLDQNSLNTIALNVFDEKNAGVLEKYNQKDRLAVFKYLITPATVENLKANPVAFERMRKWANVQFKAINRTAMDTIVQGKETNLGSDVTFDGKQFVMSGKAYTGWTGAGSSFATNGVGWLMDQGIESAKTAETTSAVAQMNGYINTMIPVWETMGMTPEQGLAQAFSVENFNSMEFKGTLFQQMGTAVRNWITGTEVDPKTGKVVPPKEDASKQESKAKSGDVLSADEYLQSVSNKPIEHVQGLDDTFAVNLAGMLQAAPPEIKAGLGVYSGYRSIERQKELFAAAVKKYGSEEAARKWVAPPGRSNHNHGKAADLSWNGESLKNAPAWVVKWVHQNAGTYGLNFPLNNENWHIEPIGIRGKKKTQMASK